VAADNLHLTLAFLGEVSAEKQRALAALAGRIRQPGFTLTLDDAGQWLRSRVVWLGTRQPPRGLLQLASMLRARRRAAAAIKARSRFIRISPCCAMPRGADSAPAFSWTFPVNEFVLYESSFAAGAPATRRWNVIPLTRKADAVHPPLQSAT
jgi:2'-5' RNA ligase